LDHSFKPDGGNAGAGLANSESLALLHQSIRRIPIDRVREMSVADKKQWLEVKCEERRTTYLSEFITLVVERNHMVRDSFY
jgi:hypothetical protein